MSKEEINYDDYTLDPAKDVLVPMKEYMAMHRIMEEVEREHTSVVTTDKHAHFDRVTHQKLSNKSKVKLSDEDLASRYYENLDYEGTEKSMRIDRTPLGFAAVKMSAALRGVFRHNIEQGNGILKQSAKPKEGDLKKDVTPLTKT